METLSHLLGTECLVSILVTSGRGLSGQYLDSLVDGLPSTINQYIPYHDIRALCTVSGSNVRASGGPKIWFRLYADIDNPRLVN